MGEPKPTASLSSVLLARKGGARPAMRRPSSLGDGSENAVTQDDLGWNDMGYDVNPAPDAPMDHEHNHRMNPLAGAVPEAKPEVRQQQERIAQQLQAPPETVYPKDEISNAVKQTTLPVGGVWTADQEETVAGNVAEPEKASIAAPVPTPVLVPTAAKVSQPAVAKIVKAVQPKKRAAPGSKSKAAFTLRLDKERHLKLRLACAVSNKSAQNIVTEALDALLNDMPEIGQLAASVPAKSISK
ncbi:MAG: hypothetical protein V3V15_07910 [Sphingorhabdus sp.]